MASTVNAKQCCNVMIAAIDNYFATTPGDKIEMPGVLAGLMSADNRGNLDIIPTRGRNNEIIDFRGRFIQNGRQDATDGYPNKCDTSGDMTGQKSHQYETMTPKSAPTLILDEAGMQEICHSVNDDADRIENVSGFEHAQKLAMQHINQLLVAIDDQLTSALVANTGKFKDSTSAKKTLNLLRTVDLQNDTPNGDGIVKLLSEFDDLEVRNQGDLLVFGSGILRDYFLARDYAFSHTGSNFNEINAPFRFFRTGKIDNYQAGTDNIIAMKSGMAVPFFKTEFSKRAYQMEMPDFSKRSFDMQFDFGGVQFSIPVDMQVYYNKCNTDGSPVAAPHGKWAINFTTSVGLATLPSDIEPSGSPFEGVNYILPFQGARVTS